MDVMTHRSPTDTADYWRDRAKEVGHPGWKNPTIYAYDQRQRLRLLEQRIVALGLPAGARVFDFGCGTGDFSRLLLGLGLNVVAYDPFVAPAIEHPRFSFVSSPERFSAMESAQFALILSVTVLDHVLDANEFEGLLVSFRRLAAPGAQLLALEYAPDVETPAPAAHQAYRSLSTWRSALSRAGWSLGEHWPVFHPVHAPAPNYESYRRRLLIRLLARGSALPLLAPATAWALGVQAQRAVRGLRALSPADSPLKLLHATALVPEAV